eukprot:3810290-Pyramimonas_sp.AAC.1
MRSVRPWTDGSVAFVPPECNGLSVSAQLLPQWLCACAPGRQSRRFDCGARGPPGGDTITSHVVRTSGDIHDKCKSTANPVRMEGTNVQMLAAL